MIGEVVPAMACHMMVAFHTAAAPYSLVDCWLVDILVGNFHVHKDAALEHDCHTLVRHIHAHSPAEKVLPGNKELDAHNLDHVAAHNYNLPVMGNGTWQG